MTDQEKATLKQERKQIKATLESIRVSNNAIGKELTGTIKIVGSIRASQLGIDLMLTDLEEKIK
ncbi:MAG: hypothetical protein GH144_04525 [Clostridia bacterium]|jgi:hypothetical protein|nr:hypothetical protein [Clostridia bacterium]